MHREWLATSTSSSGTGVPCHDRRPDHIRHERRSNTTRTTNARCSKQSRGRFSKRPRCPTPMQSSSEPPRPLEALLTVLAGILAMSPSATRSPTAIRTNHRRSRQAASPADRRGRAERGSSRIYSPDISRQRHGRDRMMRRILPQRRRAETFAIVCRNQPVTITAGFYDDGALGEVFIIPARAAQIFRTSRTTPP